MTARNLPSDDSSIASRTSRRALLRALTATPVAVSVVTPPWSEALATLHREHNDEPAFLCRSREGRSLSRFRYHRAESFFGTLEAGILTGNDEVLYYSGIVTQLGLSAHLLDIGFEDEWCARHIGLRVAKGLAYANATGLGHTCPDMSRLAMVLTPYWKWRQPRWDDPMPADGGFTADQVRPLLRALLNRVQEVTGHSRPNGWRRRLGGR
ncbi:MAG: hypothetical protein JWL96_315 [Sphingomonas bacterium]|uniref:hypothetical protein n=1 Tax=Sphingomonas bacterium TaxID=1895847 RepID=UPI00260BEFFF|nr:hypothetical protein [Sphingomonas bacterium]MDB5708245.1 hypothetical protein [Sphingomonas bacterium]